MNICVKKIKESKIMVLSKQKCHVTVEIGISCAQWEAQLLPLYHQGFPHSPYILEKSLILIMGP